jgi:hypothetical protein
MAARARARSSSRKTTLAALLTTLLLAVLGASAGTAQAHDQYYVNPSYPNWSCTANTLGSCWLMQNSHLATLEHAAATLSGSAWEPARLYGMQPDVYPRNTCRGCVGSQAVGVQWGLQTKRTGAVQWTDRYIGMVSTDSNNATGFMNLGSLYDRYAAYSLRDPRIKLDSLDFSSTQLTGNNGLRAGEAYRLLISVTWYDYRTGALEYQAPTYPVPFDYQKPDWWFYYNGPGNWYIGK